MKHEQGKIDSLSGSGVVCRADCQLPVWSDKHKHSVESDGGEGDKGWAPPHTNSLSLKVLELFGL